MLKLIGPQPTISRKIVNVLKLGNLENKTIHTPPPPILSNLGCLFFLQLARTAAQCCMEGVREESFIFPLLSWQNVRDAL